MSSSCKGSRTTNFPQGLGSGIQHLSQLDVLGADIAMSGLNPLPPHVVHSSTRLTHAQAHSMLSDFLQNAENDAAYRPDSTLTDHGPQSASIGANPNLTLHHLKRILQGIEGKRVGGENVNTLFGDLAGANSKATAQNRRQVGAAPAKNKKSTSRGNKANEHMVMEDVGQDEVMAEIREEGEGWQDKDDYELAQDEQEYEVAADQSHPAGVEQPADEEEAQEEMEVHVEEERELTKAEKKARKEAKKQRKKQEQREREKARIAN